MVKSYSQYFGGEVHQCSKCFLILKRRKNESDEDKYEIYEQRTATEGYTARPKKKQVEQKVTTKVVQSNFNRKWGEWK